jgi:mono/diheme cytochrome c family protein
MRTHPRGLLAVAALVAVACRAGAAPPELAVPKGARATLDAYCVGCHGPTNSGGGVRLDALEKLAPAERADVLNRVQDQLFFGMMPPPKREHPPAAETRALAAWVRAELRARGASKLDARLPYPDAGNYVDHAALFDGSNTEKPFTPARRWLVSPHVFAERVLDVFQLEGRERENLRRSGFYGVTNPFVLPDHAGVRDYDLHALDGGHLLVMLANAEWIASKQLQPARAKAGDPKATPEDPKDKWVPKTTPPAFAAIVAKTGAPTDDELREAVQTQFALVLRRAPSTKEAAAYLKLAREAVALGGNTEGLRQVLKAVLLESEFVYRLEFGAGTPDAHGRVPLAPREAAFAIAYALGDRGPDAALLAAAESGKLTTKADYEREVRRLLADRTYFAGPVDQSLGFFAPTAAPHPRAVRFFREFFGYPTAVKVFKDGARADGHYSNADRGNTQTPGRLIDEADRVVLSVLEADQAVFETLLTTDKYFVYHPHDNEKGAAQIAKWKAVYEALKDTDWKKNPDKVAAEHAEVLKKYIDPKGITGKSKAVHDNSVVRLMTHFEYTFGNGRTPFTILPWAHGNQFWYAPIYNLPAMPGRGGKYGGNDRLDYQPVQPFALPNRKGVLTHPAWLIAFSANTASDPIRRGRWIREKLLAGVVPDVPITVDAKVPDDPHRTLRERVGEVTKAAACAKCHSRMNDLGYPLEQFDDFGRFRTAEKLEHPDNLLKAGNGKSTFDVYKTKPIDATGVLSGTGDPKLDGPVKDAFDLIDRLAKSDRARQSIIRHAFRFYMGRNELPSDAQTLRAADRAYLNSNGSFKAVIVSLLTSDSFIYRKTVGN